MARFIPVQEAIEVANLGNKDYLQRAKGRMLKWSKYVYQDLNLTTVKAVKRELFKINKRTNTVDLPCDFLQLSSVNVIDRCGTIYPVFRNDNVKGSEIVDVPSKKDCACEEKCSYQLCNLVKGYHAIQETRNDFLPDGTPISFNCVDRITFDRNGFVYKETQNPLRVYMSGVWTDTILNTVQEKLCAVELDQKGCIKDTEQNVTSLCNSCGWDEKNMIPMGGTSSTPPLPNVKTWSYYCNSKYDFFSVQCGQFPHGFRRECNNVYNISELGNRLIFPHDFGFDRVLIRYYTDINLNDLQIPFIALDTFIAGLKWWDNRFDDKRQELAAVYKQEYSKLKWGLLLELNKYRISELRMILTPPVYMPSYNLGVGECSYGWSYGWNGNNNLGTW